jgi:hypothetical protein
LLNRGSRKTQLILISVLSLISSTILFVLNIESGTKIAHYESPEGILERVLNHSAEAEYNATLRVHNLRLLIGIFFLAVTLGSLGLYISEARSEWEKQFF